MQRKLAVAAGGIVAIVLGVVFYLRSGLNEDESPRRDLSRVAATEPAVRKETPAEIEGQPKTGIPRPADAPGDEEPPQPFPRSRPEAPPQGDLMAVEKNLRAELSRRPMNGIAHANLAAVLEAQGRIEEAGEHYQKAVEYAPAYSKGRHDYGIFLAEQLQKYDQALEHLQAAVRHDPETAQMRVALGYVLGQKGDFAGAIDQFRRAIEISRFHVDAHFYLASALDEQDKVPEAEEHYREALRLNPNHHAAHYGLGTLLVQQGKLPEAVSHFQIASQSPNPGLREVAIEAIEHVERAEEAAAAPAEPPASPLNAPATPREPVPPAISE